MVCCVNHIKMKKLFTIIMMALALAGISQAATVDVLRTPDVTGLNVNEQEMEALRFLYAYMPLADVTDYTVQFHLEQMP